MLKQVKAMLKQLMNRKRREFHDQAESKKFEQGRPHTPFEAAAIYGIMR